VERETVQNEADEDIDLFCEIISELARLLRSLESRTRDELRAEVMTAVISVNTLAAPVGFLAAGQRARPMGCRASIPRSSCATATRASGR